MKKSINKKVKKVLDKLSQGDTFPKCSGSFEHCPSKKIDPHNPPARCTRCPMYVESRFYQPPQIELDDFARSVFSKKS